ncbi:terpene synthase family protein [Embleya hyalina]|uniref:Terpene synthase n=1 Tax=Embleya hyalina TaxID=516124 RepID=A0A401YR58_9ACTN|nr:terpene synthase family protein [Embleya hyalina]GCD97090.1 germacrene A synthase [Embleya hyalina]
MSAPTVTDLPIAFRLPELANTLPKAFHPETDRLMDESRWWARRHLGFAYAGNTGRVDKNVDGTLLVSLSMPHADYELALCAAKVMNYLIGIENSLVDKAGLGGSSFATRNVFGRFMADLIGWGDGHTPLSEDFGWLRNRMPRDRWTRFVSYLEDFAHGFTTELEDWRDAGVSDYDTYMRDRRHSLGVRWLFGFAEEAIRDLRIPPQAFEHPDVVEIHDTAIDGYTLINDLVSYRKELVMGDHVNLVYHLGESEGLDLEGAMNRICALIDETEGKFLDLRDRISNGPHGDAPGMRGYLNEVGHIMTSNLWWATVSERYQPGGFPWDGSIAGTMTFHRDRVDFLADPPADD